MNYKKRIKVKILKISHREKGLKEMIYLKKKLIKEKKSVPFIVEPEIEQSPDIKN